MMDRLCVLLCRSKFVLCEERPSQTAEKAILLYPGQIGDHQKADVTAETVLVPYRGLNVGITKKRRKD